MLGRQSSPRRLRMKASRQSRLSGRCRGSCDSEELFGLEIRSAREPREKRERSASRLIRPLGLPTYSNPLLLSTKVATFYNAERSGVETGWSMGAVSRPAPSGCRSGSRLLRTIF